MDSCDTYFVASSYREGQAMSLQALWTIRMENDISG